ncbi:hypothetical protein AURDEDRAFT_57515 [Auricularia subglabra TFB-10046 SS5]|nr:hypothetical protein AURDEDRAFT_57515 [Auricularia subglabra TFB-10046 SS5]
MAIGELGDVAASNSGLATGDKPGIALRCLTQGLANKGIRKARSERMVERRKTVESIGIIKEAMREFYGKPPTTRQIWQDLRSGSLTRQAREFLWKAIHGVHKTGAYFKNMKQPWSDYATCPACGVEESLEHILLDCPQSGQQDVWVLVDDFLAKMGLQVDVTYGLILGCASVRVRDRFTDRILRLERIFKIVVSESAFLIWKIRCEARMEHGGDPEWHLPKDAIAERWWKVIRRRKHQDIASVDKVRYGKKAKPKGEIYETWRDPLD